MTELKPCPFCGSTDLDILEGSAAFRDSYTTVVCLCMARVRSDSGMSQEDRKAQAIERWNRRTPELSIAIDPASDDEESAVFIMTGDRLQRVHMEPRNEQT